MSAENEVKQVKRYDWGYETMEEFQSGDYVEYDDYESLFRTTISLETAQKLADLLKQLEYSHTRIWQDRKDEALAQFEREKGGASMNALEKAAMEAALAVANHVCDKAETSLAVCYTDAYRQQGAEKLEAIILRHLSPIQAELDAKEKMIKEAKDLITRAMTIDYVSEGYVKQQQDWLARYNK